MPGPLNMVDEKLTGTLTHHTVVMYS